MRVLVTGSSGFIGRNLVHHLERRVDTEIIPYTRLDTPGKLAVVMESIDFIFHLAGVNRPADPREFEVGNCNLTSELANALRAEYIRTGRTVPVVFASSIQAERDNPYGRSKLAAERSLLEMGAVTGAKVHLIRLSNVFGKWCRPNYNSVIATFCHNVARGLPITINDPAAPLRLVYIDDVVGSLLKMLDGVSTIRDVDGFLRIEPEYVATVGDVAERIIAFRDSRQSLTTGKVGQGFLRALYATYLSYLPPSDFSYRIPQYDDARGTFAEMLKTPDCGQFSFFTAPPGVTRGGHYHHTKNEKFLVLKGKARFRFKHIGTGETHEVRTEGIRTEIVETVPGWAHDITNIGNDELVVMLWANEVFDRQNPDTYTSPL